MFIELIRHPLEYRFGMPSLQKYYIEPLYTGVGSYDAVKISANVVNNIQIQYPTGALIGLLMNVIYQDFRPSIKCKVYKR